MPSRNFRGKPSDSHIIWSRETRNGVARKRFDSDRLEQWAGHFGFDLEREKRVDHDRGADKRTQYQCVFAWTSTGGESIEFGDEEWELGNQRTPRTFIEIDDEGIARVKSWDDEFIVDIKTMAHKGPVLLVQTSDGDTLKIDGEQFATRPDE